MKELVLKKNIKIYKGKKQFYLKDFTNSSQGFTPGEWIYINDTFNKEKWIAFINLYVAQGAHVRVICNLKEVHDTFCSEEALAESTILKMLREALERRSIFKDLSSGSRIIYGDNDQLPGLIVDSFINKTIVQINTAGLDRFRDLIKAFFEKHFGNDVFMLDKGEYRKNECLPVFEKEIKLGEIEISENKFKYFLPEEVIQKTGYYYDHRDNRARMERSLSRLNISLKKGLDLFSYCGSWGLHALRAGCEQVQFVDQGDLGKVTLRHLKENGFAGRGEFKRQDVFSFLGQADSKYDLIIADPPAFSKSQKNIKNALVGYEKLFNKIFPLLSAKSILVAASCTYGVSFSDLDNIVNKSALMRGKSIQLIDIGHQGADHPTSSLGSSSCYIKYLLYIVE